MDPGVARIDEGPFTRPVLPQPVLVQRLDQAIEAFMGQYRTSEGESLINEEPVEAMDAADRGQERVQVKRSS